MELRRLLRHLCASHRMQRRAFPPRVTDAITEAVRCVEQHDEAEIRFVVEAALEPLSLLRRQTSRERALELFSLLGVWDTAHNDGVLIYVLLADRAVEIVVDRGIAARVPSETWAVICRRMEASFARRDYQHGALAAIRAVAKALGRTAAPDSTSRRSELPDQPLLL
jgi:uncharacterized membrane protein